MDTIPQNGPKKQCPVCLKDFPNTDGFFYKRPSGKNGLDTYCKKCRYHYNQANKKKPKIPKPVIPEGMKQCSECLEMFPATLEYFHQYKRSKDGLRNLCKPCRSKRDNTYRQNNPETYLKNERRYRAKHRERVKKNGQRYYLSPRGREISRKRQSRYRLRHPERNLEQRKKYYWTHLEQEHANMKVYRLTHRDYFRVALALRRARLRNVPGTYTSTEIQDMLKRQKYICYYCRKKFAKQGEKYIYHIEHVIPITREGARNDISNIVLACPTCNRKKHTKLPHEWPEGNRLL